MQPWLIYIHVCKLCCVHVSGQDQFVEMWRGTQVWKGAQLVFSLCVSVALFSQSPFGLPFAVIGFWKLGFPETLGCFRKAFHIGTVNQQSIAAYLNGKWSIAHGKINPSINDYSEFFVTGIGCLVHHSSGTYIICATLCCPHATPRHDAPRHATPRHATPGFTFRNFQGEKVLSPLT